MAHLLCDLSLPAVAFREGWRLKSGYAFGITHAPGYSKRKLKAYLSIMKSPLQGMYLFLKYWLFDSIFKYTLSYEEPSNRLGFVMSHQWQLCAGKLFIGQ
jgi:hypothetical protein